MRISKLIGAVAGVLMTLAGFGMAVAGGVALAIPDDDGWISVGPARVRSDAAALVSDDIQIDLDDHIRDGRTVISWDAIATEITVEDRNDKNVFIGVGPVADVDRYLAGTAVAYAKWDHDDFDVEGALREREDLLCQDRQPGRPGHYVTTMPSRKPCSAFLARSSRVTN